MNDDSKSSGSDSNSGITTVITQQLAKFARRLLRYRVVLFIALIASLYGFIAFQTYHLSNETASAPSGSQTAALTPHVDKAVVEQLMSLKDNSVNVQALFNQSRTNPFAE